ncbi:unnamed protein product [Hymenolepis diminuta]|uniref:LysM domain-containing protein n=1 Tax=Hymenolepis diminuta TaxID=6216 RepID=A0A564Y131_HYMDI|nr:unnamed protein product [Hymenolepis diminuta]
MEYIEMSATKQPIPHGSYIVKAGDSLMSIAARVGDVTPAQLARFNRLGMLGASHPPLFPGQRLYIPNKNEVSAQNVRLRHVPGAATRVRLLSRENPDQLVTSITTSFDSQSDASSPSFREGVMESLFVKVKAKRVLLPSKSEIDGLLIFTPDTVCFDALATASALNRANAVKRQDSTQLSTSVKSDDMGEISKGSIAASPPISPLVLPEPILEAAEPVHDVMALSVCIPIAAVVSLNTHGDMRNLLAVFHTKALKKDPLSKEHTTSTEIEIFPYEKSPEITRKSPTRNKTKSDALKPESEFKEEENTDESPEKAQLPEEVYISIGVDTEKIFSSVPPIVTTPNADHTTLSEAASTSLHVFKIPLDKLADIHDILVSATNLLASHRSAPAELNTDANTSKTVSFLLSLQVY